MVIDTSGDDAVELIRAATGGGPHAVIDFVGMPATCGMGRDAMRKGGTQVNGSTLHCIRLFILPLVLQSFHS